MPKVEAVARLRGGSITDRVRAIRDQAREETGELGADRRARSAALFGDRFHKGIVRRPLLQDGQPREAVTRYTRLQLLGGHSLVRARPEHGRTHQVRRHLASLGHPVLGDPRHGDAPSNRHFALAHGLDRTFLHLERLELVHPQSGAPLVLEAALAPDLSAVLEALRAANATARAR